MSDGFRAASREFLLNALYEAVQLEHNLVCTYLYAAFSLKAGEVKVSCPPPRASVRVEWQV